MKKIGALILLFALCLCATTLALAERSPVARSDTFAAYTDGDGHLFLSGRDEAINTQPAESVVAIDAYRVLFLSPDGQDSKDLYMIDLESLKESLVAKGVRETCLADEDSAWYVSDGNRNQLTRVDLNELSYEVAYTAGEPIDRLYRSIEGLVFQMTDQAGTMLYVNDTHSFELYGADIPRSGLLTDAYEIYITDGGELYLRNGFNYTSALIDSDVTACALLNGSVYYLSRSGSALRLKVYDTASQTSRVVLTPGVRMTDQLTATEDALFMLTADGDVCKVNVDKGTLAVFKHYNDLSGYELPAGYAVNGLRIEGMSGQLNVYADLKDENAKPEFSFIEFESETEAAESLLRLIDVNPLKSEESVWELLTPTAQYQPLARGSRGDAVRAIQQPLKDLGYYDYYVDGIFGPRTQAAVQLLQFDLDRPVTGIADAELQKIILSGTLKPFDPYLQLTRGNRGLRVRLMQERLRELGYLADAADGIFGPRTLKAVQLFQSENGLRVDNSATRETLMRLYASTANRCSSYIDLYPGDTGCRVRELNNRLKELYYLENSPGSVYTSETASAVRVFQRTVGMRETGIATQAVLRELFAHDAPEAPGYIVLRRSDNNERVRRLQHRLKDLGYYNGKVDGYYGKQTKQAVALFQKKVGLKPTGIATVRTQQLLFASDAPEYVKPTVIGVPDIYVEDYEYENGDIYFITEDNTSNGFIIFTWDTEGSVESYDVRITDDRSRTVANTNTIRTSTGLSIATLDYDTVYTLSVTANPEDGDSKHVTRSQISFVVIDPQKEPEIGSVGNPAISIETVARVEGGVSYLVPGNVTFRWHAEGDVDSYYVEIHDEEDEVVISATMDKEQATIRSDAMNAGEIYTIFVYAIPENGTIANARVKFLRFALPVIALPSADPTPIPTAVPTPEPTAQVADAPTPVVTEDPDEDLEPVPTAEATPEPVVENTPEPLVEETTEPQAEEPEEAYDDEPVIDESQEKTDSGREAIDSVQAPEIFFSNVEDQQYGVTYISGDVLTMSWNAEGDVAAYYVELRDSGDIILDSKTVQDNSLSAYTAMLNPAEVYTLLVTAIPANGKAEDGATSSAMFAVYTDTSDEPAGDEESPDDSQEDYTESGTVYEERDEEVQETPEETSEQPMDSYDDSRDAYEAPQQTADENEDISAEPEESWEQQEEAYAEPEEAWEQQEEAYAEPEEAWEQQEEAYAEPEEAWEQQEEAYTEPEEAWEQEEETYAEPEEAWEQQEDVYVESDDEWADQEEVYVEPDDEWEQQEEVYEVPDEEWEAPDEEPHSSMSADEIKKVQKRLVKLGWLVKDEYSSGTMDDVTIDAIISFQDYCNSEFGMELPMLDEYDPYIDDETMELLNSDDYSNPEA